MIKSRSELKDCHLPDQLAIVKDADLRRQKLLETPLRAIKWTLVRRTGIRCTEDGETRINTLHAAIFWTNEAVNKMQKDGGVIGWEVFNQCSWDDAPENAIYISGPIDNMRIPESLLAQDVDSKATKSIRFCTLAADQDISILTGGKDRGWVKMQAPESFNSRVRLCFVKTVAAYARLPQHSRRYVLVICRKVPLSTMGT